MCVALTLVKLFKLPPTVISCIHCYTVYVHIYLRVLKFN